MAEAKNPVQAVDRTFDILEIIRELNGARLCEIADRVDIGMSAVHNHLATMVDRGYVVRKGEVYDIGLPFLGLGSYARNQTRIYETGRPEIDRLASETDRLASLVVEKQGMGIYVYQASGETEVELDTHPGKQVHLHCTALGKALLAFRPDEEIHAILDEHGLPAMTNRTITDREKLFEEIARIRERQYAVDRGERLNGLRCIGAPVTDGDGRSIAAISVTCPSHRIDDGFFHEELPELVLGSANMVEIKNNYA
jgi:DNA-binding IclR family transcriptional regulator